MHSTLNVNKVNQKDVSISNIWNPAFNEFKFGNSPEEISSKLPIHLVSDWDCLPQASEYKHDLVKYFWLKLTVFGNQISKFIPPDVSINDESYICYLFFNRKLFHISIRFFHDESHENYDQIVEAYARAVNTSTIERHSKKEFYYDDSRIIYFSCFEPNRLFTCMNVIRKDQTTSTDGHWFGLPEFHDHVPKSFTEMVQPSKEYQYDIMISYSHKDKELCHQIYKRLTDSQFRVWIDLENMYGPIVARMAEAIENSQFVLLCMSDAYKSSAYCQLEAEYAFKFGSILIPLVVKKDFKQTGWLGMLCGLRLHIDFTKTSFEEAYVKLINEIQKYMVKTNRKLSSSKEDDHEKKQVINRFRS